MSDSLPVFGLNLYVVIYITCLLMSSYFLCISLKWTMPEWGCRSPTRTWSAFYEGKAKGEIGEINMYTTEWKEKRALKRELKRDLKKKVAATIETSVLNMLPCCQDDLCPLKLQIQTFGTMVILTRKCQFGEMSAWQKLFLTLRQLS